MGGIAVAPKFFSRRIPIDFGFSAYIPAGDLIQYANVPRIIGTLISSRLATLAELQTVYGVEDAYNLLEVLSVDVNNERAARVRRDGN